MTLTVADIDRWDPEAVREVCHAAKTRGVIAQEAGDGLARLPAFKDWDGQTALAARDAIGNTRVNLNAHGEEALAVARAADMAADGIQDVRKRLTDLRQHARSLHTDVDPGDQHDRAGPDFKGPAGAESVGEGSPTHADHRTSPVNARRWVMRSMVWAICVAVACALLGGCGSSSSKGGNKGDDVSPEHIAALENQLRSKPPFEAAQTEYQAAVTQTADAVAALVPGLTWQFTENSWLHCGGQYLHTRATQVYQRVKMSGPIPDDKWPQALQVGKDTAGRLGATEVQTLVDQTATSSSRTPTASKSSSAPPQQPCCRPHRTADCARPT